MKASVILFMLDMFELITQHQVSYDLPLIQMSVTVSVSKAILEDFPEVGYQLFYIADHQEEQELILVFTAKGYYRELTDLLDLYQIPYQIYSSRNVSLMHVLIFEEDGLALELKQQLEAWGFGFVEIAHNFHAFRHHKHTKIALAIVDIESLHLLSLGNKLHVFIQLLAIPLILLATYVEKRKATLWRLIKSPHVLYKPFSAFQLREMIERRLQIALITSTKH
jgi:hypothetical protein